jgi:hypothetical protein
LVLYQACKGNSSWWERPTPPSFRHISDRLNACQYYQSLTINHTAQLMGDLRLIL